MFLSGLAQLLRKAIMQLRGFADSLVEQQERYPVRSGRIKRAGQYWLYLAENTGDVSG